MKLSSHSAVVLASFLALSACGDGAHDEEAAATNGSRLTVHGVVASTDPLVVSGLRFGVSRASVTLDGVPADSTALGRGMIATVHAVVRGAAAEAEQVAVSFAMRGPVSGLLGDTLFVGGQPVLVSSGTVVAPSLGDLNAVPAGTRVRISGPPLSNGAFQATRIDDDSVDDSPEFEIKGYVSDLVLDPASFTLRITPNADTGFAVTLADGVSLPAGIATGSFVEVHAAATPVEGALIATRIELEDDGSGEDGHHSVRLQAPVADFNAEARTLTLLGVMVRLGEWTQIDADLDLANLDGQSVEARGVLAADGVVIAGELEGTNDERLILQGPVSAKDGEARTLVILGLEVAASSGTEYRNARDEPISAAELFAAVIEGSTVVKARGEDASAFAAGRLAAEEIEIELP